MSDLDDESAGSPDPVVITEGGSDPSAGPLPRGWFPKIGIWSWTFVGFVAATVILVTAFSAVSEILLPLLFAAVLAVIFKPVVGSLVSRGLKPSLASGLIVLGLLALMTVVLVGTVRGVLAQTDEIDASVDAAIANTGDELAIDAATLEEARAAAEQAAPAMAEGFLTRVVEGVSSLPRSGLRPHPRRADHVLPAEGRHRAATTVVVTVDPSIRDEVDDFIGDACRILRDYGKGRTDHVGHRLGRDRCSRASCSACRSCSPSSS